MIAAMCPRMEPKPFSSNESEAFCADPTSVSVGTPAASATRSATTISAMNGSTLNLMMSSNSTAMLTTARVSKPC